MSLVPHKIVALESATATAISTGKTTIAGAVVIMYDSDNNAITLYDDAAFTNGAASKVTGSTGELIVWITAGQYTQSVNGSTALPVTVGSSSPVTVDTFANMLLLRPEQTGQSFTCQERANAPYILQPEGVNALDGDAVCANGRLAQLQISGIVNAANFGVSPALADNLAFINSALSRMYTDNLSTLSFGNGKYIVSDTVLVTRDGIKLVGQGSGNTTTPFVVTESRTIISGSHLVGAVVHIQAKSCSMRGFCIGSETNRKNATYNVLSPALKLEGVDGANTNTDRSEVSYNRFEYQPGDGLLTSGSITMSQFYFNDSWNCKGFGFRFDSGQITSRTNTSYVGLVDFSNNRAHFCGGNALAVSDPTSTTQATMGVRFHVFNFEAVGCADDAAVRYENFAVYFFGEDSIISGCAFGGQSAALTPELHGGLYVGGRGLTIFTNRFINTNQPIRVRQLAEQPTTGMVVENIRIVQTSLTIDSVVLIEDGADVKVRVGEVDPAGDYNRVASLNRANCVTEVNGRLKLASVNSGDQIIIPDDSVHVIDFVGATNRTGVIQVVGSAPSSGGGQFHFRTGGSNAITKWGGETNTDVSTSVLNGATGTDGNLTISAASDGKIYIENRKGFSILITLFFSSMTIDTYPII